MKKSILTILVVLTGLLTFSTQNVHAIVESSNIEMQYDMTISDDDDRLVYGTYSYDQSHTSVIDMFIDYNFVKINIIYKSNSVELKYILEEYHLGSWDQVAYTKSTSGTGGVVDIYYNIDGGDLYRLRIENPNNIWNNTASDVQVRWRAIR